MSFITKAGDLLATPISVSAAPVQQSSNSTYILPRVGKLPAGNYQSVIYDVTEAVQNGQIVGIDCYHELTDSGGNKYHVRFRYYAPKEVDALAETLASYGLTGSLGSVLMGLQETVTVAPRAGSTTYLAISSRSFQVIQTTTPDSTVDSTTAASLPTKKKGGLVLRCKRGTRPSMPSQERISLLADDEEDDDEFDDFLDDNEEDE